MFQTETQSQGSSRTYARSWLDRLADGLEQRPAGRNAPVWPAPYDEDSADAAYRFLTECWHTLDEQTGRIDCVPADEFIREYVGEWHRSFTARLPLVVEKSRRMVVSWASRGLETWACGLKRSDWLIVDQTHANAAEHLWRVHFALEQLYERRPELGIARHQVRGSTVTREPTHVILPNGSTLTQLHQEAGSVQGKGKTGITLEEISKYRAPSSYWNQAVMLTQGRGGEPGGFICGIANADPDPDWRSIKRNASARALLGMGDSETAGSDVRHPIAGFGAQTLGSGDGAGVRHVAIHYSADPSKAADWVRRQRGLMAQGGKGQRDWDREMELREDVYDGQPVFESYEDLFHAPIRYQDEVPIVPDSLYYGGWDCGQTLSPAFVLVQVTPNPFQQHVVLEVVSDGAESMEDFAPRVMTALVRWHAGLWGEVRHYGDATVTIRSGSNGRSAQQVARKHGFEIMPVSNAWQARWSAVTWALNRRIDEKTPGLFIVRSKCPVLREGFLGAYKIEERRDRDGNVKDLLVPVKNSFSHVQDALQYPLVKIRQMIEGGGARVRRAD